MRANRYLPRSLASAPRVREAGRGVPLMHGVGTVGFTFTAINAN